MKRVHRRSVRCARRVLAVLASLLCAAPSMQAIGATSDLPPELAALLPALREDAARRSGAAASLQEIVAIDEVTWSDGALGCPQPGQSYTMALVPGFRVVLAAGSARQHYHADRRGHWLWCPATRSAVPPGSVQRM